MFKKEKASQAIGSKISSLSSENQKLYEKRESTLGIFKDTVRDLRDINKELKENSDECTRLANELNILAQDTNVEIEGNERVISKIEQIFI